MRNAQGFAAVVTLGLALVVLAGRAALLAGAPSTEECVDQWTSALDNGNVEVDVRPEAVLLTSQGAAEWNGQYPVCWLTFVENDRTCQTFHSRPDNAVRWDSDPVGTCGPSWPAELDPTLLPTSDGRITVRHR